MLRSIDLKFLNLDDKKGKHIVNTGSSVSVRVSRSFLYIYTKLITRYTVCMPSAEVCFLKISL